MAIRHDEITDISKVRRVYRGEEEFFPLLAEFGHGRLRLAFLDSGISATISAGLVFFIEDQMRLDRHQTDKTRVKYRKILKSLDVEEVRSLASRPIGE